MKKTYTGELRVRVFCESCGYVWVNGTRVYMVPEVLDCPKCHKKNSMCAVVELPDGHNAPIGEIKLIIYDEVRKKGKKE